MSDCETEGHVWEIGPYGKVTKCTFCGEQAETSPTCEHGVLWTLNCSLCDRWCQSKGKREAK